MPKVLNARIVWSRARGLQRLAAGYDFTSLANDLTAVRDVVLFGGVQLGFPVAAAREIHVAAFQDMLGQGPLVHRIEKIEHTIRAVEQLLRVRQGLGRGPRGAVELTEAERR